MSGEDGANTKEVSKPTEAGDEVSITKPAEDTNTEKNEQPSSEAPVADEFGLPVKPPRRRDYDEEEAGALGSNTVGRASSIQQEVNGIDMDGLAGDQVDAISAVHEPREKAVPGEDRSEPAATSSIDEQTHGASLSKQSSPASPNQTTKKLAAGAVSEWSHQQAAPHKDMEDKDEVELAWQDMPALATHRQYDDWGKVVAKSYDEVEDETVAYGALGGAGKGYTRVQVDDDVASQTSFDDNTAYLFKEGHARNVLVEDDDEEARDLVTQMQTTKLLLTESQRFAYVAVVRLSMVSMLEQVEKLEHTKGAKKQIDLASEAMKMWAQKMMVRLYAHMEISEQEQIMVEQLAEHGLRAEDLTPELMKNARVKNPKAPKDVSEKGGSETASVSSARPSISSPRPSSGMEKRMSTMRLSAPGTPAPSTPVSETPPPAYEEQRVDDMHIEDPTNLPDTKDIDLDIRWTVLCDLFLLLIADSTYDSRSRTLLETTGAALSVDWPEICRFEKRVTDALEMQEQADKENWNEDEHMAKRKKKARNKRLLVMGLCTVGGGLVIGLSAGLLAPVIGAGLAAGFTTVGVAGTSGFLTGAGGAAIVGTTGVLSGGVIAGKASNRRTGAVRTFEYRPLHNNKRVNLIVTISGWMTGKVDDVRLPFSTVDPVMGDIYSVHWEPDMLQSTGQTIQILATEALTQTIQQILGSTILTALMAGLSLPIILTKLSYLIDNPWTVSLTRADAAGLILADSLIDRNLGVRPITLVGFSLGSRVIFSCLRELANRGALGLIQNVYLFGTPVVTKKDEWLRARSVVSGRFVNGYATNDWILGYLFRATSGGISRIAGLSEVQQVHGIENLDVTEIVPGHMAYRGRMPVLLRTVGWEVESDDFAEIEDPDPENHEKRQRELINEIEEARAQLERDGKPEKKGFLARFSRKKGAEKKAWETYDEKTLKAAGHMGHHDAEKGDVDNANVMFDVDAIRREALVLAQNGGDIEEIKGHLQIREIESTMPPMRISSPAVEKTAPVEKPATVVNGQPHRVSLKRPKSFAVNTSSSSGLGSGKSELRNGNVSHARSASGSRFHEDLDETHEQVSLSFEAADSEAHGSRGRTASPFITNGYASYHPSPAPSYHSPAPAVQAGYSTPPALPDDAWSSKTNRNGINERPPIRSSKSTPEPTHVPTSNHLAESRHPGHNPWADDEIEVGKEKEVEMSFE